jgi:hypothetical protein
MSDPERPDPDEILARLKREETAATRGKLKIFFGMSPGVGKTFAMLQAAQQKLAQDTEVASANRSVLLQSLPNSNRYCANESTAPSIP